MHQAVGRVSVLRQHLLATGLASYATIIDGFAICSTLESKVIPHAALHAALGYKF